MEKNCLSNQAKNSRDWLSFYQTSPRSAGLLCWYPFSPNASLLQIGGSETLTGMFCDRCRSVAVLERDAQRASRIKTNASLHVFSGGLSSLPASSSFDYIVFIVGPDTAAPVFTQNDYAGLLKTLKSRLSPEGRLLFAVSNRFGVQALCGSPDLSTGIPFDGPNGYPTGAIQPSVSRDELLRIIKDAGFSKTKLYYPFPDHFLPQTFYTDAFPPGSELAERLRPYAADRSSLVIRPDQLYRPLSENGLMPFFCNSFLAECGDGNLSPVLFAAVSTERRPEERFATVILENGTVVKQALSPAGEKGLARLEENSNALSARGLSVVPFHRLPGRLVMPRIGGPTLSDFLAGAVLSDSKTFLACLDGLYREILRSSDTVPAKRNALLSLAPDADWGPILSKAYLEMIPVNCFYRHGRFLFFDQEFVRENYPAKYVLFRAVRDLYSFSPRIARHMPLESLQERYRLKELWDIFCKEEDRFQDKLRQRKKQSCFYRWTDIRPETIIRNIRKLQMDNETGPALSQISNQVFLPLAGCAGKEIVLFGAGRMAEHYLKKYGAQHPPVFLVDNDARKWGTEKLGYPVKKPDVLTASAPGRYHVIICNGAYSEIAAQLTKMGILDFHIYVRAFDELREAAETKAESAEKYDVGYVTGAFDMFHIGHLNLLRRCKERCRHLIAGVLTDEICVNEKGKQPVIPFEERFAIVEQIKYVDKAIPVDAHNTDKLEAWKQLRYDCHFSGTDHEEEWFWLKKQLQAVGSNMEFFPYTRHISSTKLRERLLKGESPAE